MKIPLFLCCTVMLFAFTCGKDDGTPIPDQSAGIAGEWQSKTIRYQHYSGSTLEEDTTVNAPFENLVDAVTKVKFTADSCFVELNGEGYSWAVKYQKSGDAIIGFEDGASDTLFVINNLTASQLNYRFVEEDPASVPAEKTIWDISAERK